MNKKGFTLIEVLATVIILSILSIITMPIIFGVIGMAKEATFLRSADSIVRAAEVKYADELTFFVANQHTITYDNGVLTGENTLNLRGNNPDYAIITLNSVGEVKLALWSDELNKCIYKAYLDDQPAYNSEAVDKDSCMGLAGTVFAKIAYPQVTDPNPGIIFGDALTENYAGYTNAYVKSTEDLVALANLNKTQNFSGKVVWLNSNLDFELDKSYISPTTTVFGDINGNGTIEGLKIELTTGKGFYPIGRNTAKFYGTFNASGAYLKNLYINRPAEDYVGLFGYTNDNAIVKGLNLIDAKVTGANYTGSVVGYNMGDTSSINASGTVVGTGVTGGVIGYVYAVSYSTNSLARDLVFAGDVTGTSNVGGVVGVRSSSDTTVTNLIYLSGSVTATSSYGRVMGGASTPSRAMANSAILVNGSVVTGTLNSYNGFDMVSTYLNDLNTYEYAVDTIISGDDTVDGFYFAYDVTGLPAIANATLIFDLTGAGTIGDPYLIDSADDFDKITINNTAYYKLANDIDFGDKAINTFASELNSFNGKFDGNGHTLANATISGSTRLALFGTTGSSTIISNLKIDNIDAFSTGDYTGVLSAYVYGTIKDIIITNSSVTGKNYSGLVAGTILTGTTVSSVFAEGDVTGVDYVGGVIGYINGIDYSPTIYLKDAMFAGNVTGINRVGGVIGARSTYSSSVTGVANRGGSVTGTTNYGRVSGGTSIPTYAMSNSSVLLNGVTVSSEVDNSLNGRDVLSSLINDINVYETIGLDTVIGGDNNTDGYYLDYVNDVVTFVPATIAITMSGTGTVDDPYLITNINELRQVALSKASYFKLVNNINLSGEKTYMLFSKHNSFTGNFDGNGKTISNASINGVDYTGLFGYGNGAVNNLVLNNITIKGANYVGGITSYSSGSITNIIADNITVSGIDYIGGIIGSRFGSSGIFKYINITNSNVTGRNYLGLIAGTIGIGVGVSSVSAEGDVTGTNYVGGVIGYVNGQDYSTTSYLKDAMFTGDVTGVSYVGGVAGARYAYSTSVTGVANRGGSVTGTSNYGRVVGGTNVPTYAMSNSSVLLNGVTVSSAVDNSLNGRDVSAALINDINVYETIGLDTVIGGDNNTDGYYLDYVGNIVKFVPATIAMTMSGTGTVDDPYSITNASELRQVALAPAAYFKLSNNIDLSGIKNYMLFSRYNSFTGNFDGNGKTISNISINGIDYTGLFGYSSGTVNNLTLSNVYVTGENYVGGLFGYSSSKIMGNIKISDISVTGKNYTGGLAGARMGGTLSGIMVTNADVTGASYTGGAIGYIDTANTFIDTVSVEGDVTGTTYTGGVVGYLQGSYGYSSTLNYSMYLGNVTGTSYVSGILGVKQGYAGLASTVNRGGTITSTSTSGRITTANTPSNAIALDSILVNGATVTSTSLTSLHGKDTTAANLLVQSTYTAVGFNFTDTTSGTYIWKMLGSNIWIEKNL